MGVVKKFWSFLVKIGSEIFEVVELLIGVVWFIFECWFESEVL